MPIFRVKSVKIYTGQKNLHEHVRGVRVKYQVWDFERGLHRYEVSWTLRAGYKRRRSCEGHVVESRTIKVRQRYSRARKVESRE